MPASEPEAISSASASDRGRRGAMPARDGEPGDSTRLGGEMAAALAAPPLEPEAAAQQGSGRRRPSLDALDVAAEEALEHAVITPDGGVGGRDALGRSRPITIAPRSSAQLAAVTARSASRKSPSMMPSSDADPVSIRDLAHMLSPGVEPPAFSLSESGAESMRGSHPVPALDASPTPRVPTEASGSLRTTVDRAALVRSLISPERVEKGATERSGATAVEEAAAPPRISPLAELGDVAAFRAVPELRTGGVHTMAVLVSTSDRTPATRRSRPEIDAAQPPDSSREDLSMMESLCPPPSRPGRTSGPELGAQTARGDSSGLIDLRRMAASADGDRRRGRDLRADDEVLSIQGGLFEGASAPPLSPPPFDGAGPEAGGEEPAEDEVPARATTTTAGALVSQGMRFVTSPAARQNMAVTGWVLCVFLIFGVALYFAHAGTRSAASLHAASSGAPPAPAPTPVASGAHAADREPSLDDEPPAPAVSSVSGSAAPGDEPPAAEPALSASGAAPPPTPSEPAPAAAALEPPARPEPSAEPSVAERPPSGATTSKAERPPAAAATSPMRASAEFDRSAANEALSAAASVAAGCTGEGLTGGARVAVTFGPSGQVASARVEAGDLVGTATAGCIAGAFRSARVPPFEGGHITVMKQVNIR
jgi:hypothetical protein